jgi:hypothetical protein
MVRPDYNNSIVNLMSSLVQELGHDAGNPYQPLALLPRSTITDARHIVMLVIDGLGYNYVLRHGELFRSHLQGRMTSVFPSTTASAITSLLTGYAPQQHAVTGWFMHLKEYGTIAAVLPFRARWGGASLADAGARISDVISTGNIFNRLHTPCYFVIGHDLIDSPYTLATTGHAQRRAYPYQQRKSFLHCLNAIEQIITKTHEKSFVYAYWPLLDSISHQYGVGSENALQHYQDIEAQLAQWLKKLQGSDTLLLVTADHGFIDSVPDNTIHLHDHPELQHCLSMPLCGEPRVAYCYVRPDSVDRFSQYIQVHLADHFDCYASDELVREGWFGYGDPAPRLRERIGDYILTARGNSVIVDRFPTEGPWSLVGVHGGTSEDEMYVPLIMMQC